MATFTVYQPILTDAWVEFINSHGWGGTSADPKRSEVVKAYGRATMGTFAVPNIEAEVKTVALAGIYRKTMKVNCTDIHEVFRIGNIGPEYRIERIGDMQRSVSVGDVVVDPYGTAWLCDSTGWVELFFSTRNLIETMAGTGDAPSQQAA